MLRFEARGHRTVEINPYTNRIEDLTQRSEALRGYL